MSTHILLLLLELYIKIYIVSLDAKILKWNEINKDVIITYVFKEKTF